MVVVTSFTATVPPRAVAPPAAALAVAVAVTWLVASSSSLPPTLIWVLPPTWVVAVLLIRLTATPASAGRVVRLGVPGRAWEITVELAASVASPVSVRMCEAPPTFTVALEVPAMVPRGERLLVAALKVEVALSCRAPPTAWIVLSSMSMLALAAAATTGIRVLP